VHSYRRHWMSATKSTRRMSRMAGTEKDRLRFSPVVKPWHLCDLCDSKPGGRG
jgi:hypothetical protein